MHCVVIGSMPCGRKALQYIPKNAFVIAADAGWQRAKALGLEPHLVLGDFDSAPPPKVQNLLRTPAEKDDTDTMLALRIAQERGAASLTLLGCLGGRPDHTLANIQALHWLARRGIQNLMADDTTEMRCVAPGALRLARQPQRYVSVFAHGGTVTGVYLEGLKYPLVNATLTTDYPIGVSNEFAADTACVRHETGYLLVTTTEMD